MPMRHGRYWSYGPHGFHQIAYTEWGEAENPQTALCVHGLTRNCRDFDFLAQSLESDFRVACPDVAGRGKSQWLPQASDYNYDTYLRDMASMIARLGAEKVDWIGTSMGGIIGMMLAGQPNSPVRRLVLNDIGPFIPKAAIARIGEYVGADLRFSSFDEVVEYFRRVNAGFGDLSDQQWRHLAEHSSKRLDAGDYKLVYDQAIGQGFRQEPQDVDLWPIWSMIQCPVLILRGADSDTLPADAAEQMVRRNPKAKLITFADCGHAPALMNDEQISAVRNWLTHA